jgi:hypothetical protein
MVVRPVALDSEALAMLSLLGGGALLSLAAGRAAMAWARRAHVQDVAAVGVRVALLIAIGPLGWSTGPARGTTESAPTGGDVGRRDGGGPRVRVVARGTVMALPPLIVLTALLTSADPVFERLLHDALLAGIEPLLEHIAFATAIAWLVSGYLRAFLVDDPMVERARIPRPALRASEIAFALALLDVLFLVFLAVQARYLFGGSALVEVTPGLSYAQYARRGFFELVTAAALVVPVLLLADWAGAENERRGRGALRVTATLLVVLLTGVLASAAFRMRLYQEAYGMTEQRLYVSVFMVWLTFVLVWLAGTVLRGKRRGFMFGAMAAGLICIAGVHVLNPDALIARVNIERASSGVAYDGRYLSTLSADAVPVLIARLPQLPPSEQCAVATMIRRRWSGERRGGWRTWNLADARARGLVSELALSSGCAGATASSSGASR